jgi:hypothetical protein
MANARGVVQHRRRRIATRPRRDFRTTTGENAMSHLLDPDHLANDTEYAAALGELEDLMLADPDTPAGRRFDELVRLIEDFEARHWPAEVPRLHDAREPPALYGMA